MKAGKTPEKGNNPKMEVFRIATGEKIKLKFKGHGDVKDLLIQLHDYYDLSWPQIGDLPAINPPGSPKIPISTLAKISKSGIVPQKWRERFPGVGAVDNRQRIAIRKDSMKSASKTIKKHIDPEKRLELIQLLADDPEIPFSAIIVRLIQK